MTRLEGSHLVLEKVQSWHGMDGVQKSKQKIIACTLSKKWSELKQWEPQENKWFQGTRKWTKSGIKTWRGRFCWQLWQHHDKTFRALKPAQRTSHSPLLSQLVSASMERLNMIELGSPQVRLEAKLAPLPSTLSLSLTHTHPSRYLLQVIVAAGSYAFITLMYLETTRTMMIGTRFLRHLLWHAMTKAPFGMCVHGMSRKFLTLIPRILRANILGHQAERCPWLPFNSARLSKPLAAMFFPHRERQAIADGAKFLFILSSSPSEYIYIYK